MRRDLHGLRECVYSTLTSGVLARSGLRLCVNLRAEPPRPLRQ